MSQKNGRDLDPDNLLWMEYMRLRRSKGAGYMHPEMKAEMDRVELEMQRQQPNGGGGHVDHSPSKCASVLPLCACGTSATV